MAAVLPTRYPDPGTQPGTAGSTASCLSRPKIALVLLRRLRPLAVLAAVLVGAHRRSSSTRSRRQLEGRGWLGQEGSGQGARKTRGLRLRSNTTTHITSSRLFAPVFGLICHHNQRPGCQVLTVLLFSCLLRFLGIVFFLLCSRPCIALDVTVGRRNWPFLALLPLLLFLAHTHSLAALHGPKSTSHFSSARSLTRRLPSSCPSS